MQTIIENDRKRSSVEAVMESCKYSMGELAGKAACCDSMHDKLVYYSTLNGYLFGFFSSVDMNRAKEIFNRNLKLINDIEENGNHSCSDICKYMELDHYLYETYGDLVERFVNAHERDSRIDEALNFIRDNLDQVLRTDELADMVNMSRSHFCRLFRQQTGSCLKEHIKNLRMEKAMKLLKEEKHSIEGISWECGFNSHAYFSATFRRHTGMTPGRYRTMCITGNEPTLKEA